MREVYGGEVAPGNRQGRRPWATAPESFGWRLAGANCDERTAELLVLVVLPLLLHDLHPHLRLLGGGGGGLLVLLDEPLELGGDGVALLRLQLLLRHVQPG